MYNFFLSHNKVNEIKKYNQDGYIEEIPFPEKENIIVPKKLFNCVVVSNACLDSRLKTTHNNS